MPITEKLYSWIIKNISIRVLEADVETKNQQVNFGWFSKIVNSILIGLESYLKTNIYFRTQRSFNRKTYFYVLNEYSGIQTF